MSEMLDVKHPGQILMNELRENGMTQKELAVRTGVTEKHICTIISGEKDISASFSRKLEIALGSEKDYWLKLQLEYDRYKHFLEEENNITTEEKNIAKALKEFTSCLVEFSLIEKMPSNDSEKVLMLRNELRINNLTAIPDIRYNAAYRVQVANNTKVNEYVLFAWQRLCEIAADYTTCECSFSRDMLISRLSDIKAVMFEKNISKAISRLRLIFSQCGIAFNVVPSFKGAPVNGFIKQTPNNTAILCLTVRGSRADKFWFTLFHEIGHLINGDLNVRFVDFDSVDNKIERMADDFATNALIPAKEYEAFIDEGRYTDLHCIDVFSHNVKVPIWITIGRLQNDSLLEWSAYSTLFPRYRWGKNCGNNILKE